MRLGVNEVGFVRVGTVDGHVDLAQAPPGLDGRANLSGEFFVGVVHDAVASRCDVIVEVVGS